MDMFIKGLKYVIPCQNRFSRKSLDEIVNQQYENISNVVKNCLKDHSVISYDGYAKYSFQALKNIVFKLYSKPLSRFLTLQAKKEHDTIKSIQKLLRQRPDILIRRTDKCKVFYIGKASDFERKTQEYMLKTKAYQDVTVFGCPLFDNLNAIQTLLNNLQQKKVITTQQRNSLIVKPQKLELAHFHALPKPHKVSLLLLM